MGEAAALQKLEGAIDGRRFGGLAVGAVAADQVIGLDRLPGPQKQLQHPAARSGHALAIGAAGALGRLQRLGQGTGRQAGVGMGVSAAVRHVLQLVVFGLCRNGA